MVITQLRYIFLGAAFLAAAGCSKEHAANPPEATMVMPSLTSATDYYAQKCAKCHGTSGRGDGPLAGSMPRPRDFTDKLWQSAAMDGPIAKIIVQGGAGVGKSPLMLANPDLADKPELVAGLVQVVRGFGK